MGMNLGGVKRWVSWKCNVLNSQRSKNKIFSPMSLVTPVAIAHSLKKSDHTPSSFISGTESLEACVTLYFYSYWFVALSSALVLHSLQCVETLSCAVKPPISLTNLWKSTVAFVGFLWWRLLHLPSYMCSLPQSCFPWCYSTRSTLTSSCFKLSFLMKLFSSCREKPLFFMLRPSYAVSV